MKKYKKILRKARRTGKGMIEKFQEKSNFPMAVKGCCPHCGAEFGCVWEDGKPIKPSTQSKDIYETPRNIRFMCNAPGNSSWTEDCTCGNCGGRYSQNDGCGVVFS